MQTRRQYKEPVHPGEKNITEDLRPDVYPVIDSKIQVY